MLSRRIAASARPLAKSVAQTAPRTAASSTQIRSISQADVDDPGMFRDPYGDWWDKQERKNFGEPCHEDNDIMGVFTPEEYTYTTPGKGALMLATFVGAVGALSYGAYLTYPDKPSAPREFPGGLDRELGGDRAVVARKPGEGQWKPSST